MSATGTRNEAENGVAMVGIDHCRQKPARCLMRIRPQLRQCPCDTSRLQAREFHGQRLALSGDVKQPLPPVIGSFLLHHITLLDQLLEHAAQRLLGDLENIEQLGDLHAGISVDEMQHPMMCSPEAQFRQNIVRITDEIAISEEQKLDNVPDRLRVRRVVSAGWTMSERQN